MALPVPGIPQLPPFMVPPLITLAISEVVSALLWKSAQVPPAWGVFDQNGNQVLFPDSVLELSQRQEYEVSNYPVQDGSFAAYNKVVRPFEIQMRFSKGGTLQDRATFLADIADLAASLELLDIHTPEALYTDVNLDRYEVTRRGANGAYFLTEVDCYFTQILQTQAQYTTTAVQLPNAKSPAAFPTDSVGTVTPTAPTSQQALEGQAALASTSELTF